MVSPIKVEMSQDQLAQMLVQAILDQGVGKQLQQGIQQALNSYTIKQAIEAGVAEVARDHAKRMILQDNTLREQVEGIVRETLTSEVMNRLFARALGLKEDR